IAYRDARTGANLHFETVNAVVEARSLLGPWRIEGSYLDDGVAVPFRFATGLRLDDGTIRVKTEVSPAAWPVAVAADGVLSSGEDGLAYAGTYSVAQVVPAASLTEGEAPAEAGEAAGEAATGEAAGGEATGDATGWRSEGAFRLIRDELTIEQGVLTAGP